MKLSELIATLQATLEANGDTDEIALCFVIEGRPAHRLDVFGSVTVLHDTAEYPKGMAYLVADCNVQRSRLHTDEVPSFVIMGADEGEPSNAEGPQRRAEALGESDDAGLASAAPMGWAS